ncbi:MAG: hypothetical protein HYR73_02065 [Candidatus Eisenbacteria bacterium]|nr:hypothetical protein [Candidatus Eisenbacteria bacterium]
MRRMPAGRSAIKRVLAELGIGGAATALTLALCATACAQDFAPPAPAGPSEGASSLIERALPPAAPAWRLETIATRWNGIDELSTRSLAALAGWRSLRAALGISSTGDGEIGWNAAALAAGVALPSAGAALRVIARRDRSAVAGASADRAWGLEAGAGFWSALGSRVTLWMSAPSADRRGEAPPLERGLESGLRVSSFPLDAWIALIAPTRASDPGERVAGVGCVAGAARLWLEARSAPLRGSMGLVLRRGSLGVAFGADEHPVLGETLRLSLSVGRGADP